MIKLHKRIWLLVAGLCLLLAVPVSAKQTGSLQLNHITEDVYLYCVSDENGVLTEAFSQAGIENIKDTAAADENGQILQTYVAEKHISGTKKTPVDETVLFSNLELGCYLVCSGVSEDEEFAPFLVWIPTVVSGEAVYDVQAEPKTEDPGPTVPTDPTPPEPDIPQTGHYLWPQYLLFGLGLCAILFGMIEIIRGRRNNHEQA